MPYILISCQVRLERGPTIVGDGGSEPELMAKLSAEKVRMTGNDFDEWRTKLTPRQVLDRLEQEGYHVVGNTGTGQTCAWTLFKPDPVLNKPN